MSAQAPTQQQAERSAKTNCHARWIGATMRVERIAGTRRADMSHETSPRRTSCVTGPVDSRYRNGHTASMPVTPKQKAIIIGVWLVEAVCLLLRSSVFLALVRIGFGR